MALAILGGCGAVGGSSSAGDDPKIMNVVPDHGPAIGHVMVTVTGSGFAKGTPVVVVGGVEAPTVTAASDTQLTFELPPGPEGHTVDVMVSTERGFTVASQAFQYNLLPVVLSITPAVGRALGGTNVTLTGRGFQQLEAGIPMITIGGGVATNVQIIDDRTLTATTAASVAGTPVFSPLDVELHNANGTATLARAFSETAHGLLAMDRNQNSMVWIDIATGNSIHLARFQQPQVGGCALSPTGQLFGWTVDPTDNNKLLLATLDPLTGEVTSIGKLLDTTNVAHTASALAFVGNTLFAVDTGRRGTPSTKLTTINPTNGVVTVLAAGTALAKGSAIFAKDANTLFFVKMANSTLDTVATATGVLTAGPTMTGRAVKAHGLTSVGGTMYMADSQGIVYTVNPATGATTVIGNIGARINALCETPPSF
ncbi:MAG TPA: IPT/TIG domain-containing protein [Kofleriaceae bacterium]|nr:IPT/TIG domain-containing protein [Kofleriaceae bacterium]